MTRPDAEDCPACGYEMYDPQLVEAPSGVEMLACVECREAWS